MAPALPPFAPFPESAAWRQQISAAKWSACLASWLVLVKAHLSLPDTTFVSRSLADESLPPFVAAVISSLAVSGQSTLGDGVPRTNTDDALRQGCLLLATRALRAPKPPARLVQWEFLSDFCRASGKRRARHVLAGLSEKAVVEAEASLSWLKKHLVKAMDRGIRGDLKAIEDQLCRVNCLVSAWPAAGALFLAGNDFLDALVGCFKIMNPPLRRCIVTTTYLCLIGQTEGSSPRYSLLSDTLYSLRSMAEEHKQGPLSANDSLVVELVTVTPLMQQIQKRIEASGTSTSRMVPVLNELSRYRKPQGGLSVFVPPRRIARQQADKGKQAEIAHGSGSGTGDQALHVHKLSQIAQVRDLFPDLGSAFVAKLLDEYNDDSEQVVAHLLQGTLPPHLEAADRSENLEPSTASIPHAVFTPHPTPPLPPSRRNAFDDDELDTLAKETTSKLHFGKQKSAKTADDVLRDRASRPAKATILSALAAFDSDDDERDDTYDSADVGGTVDASVTGAAGGEADLGEEVEQPLYYAYTVAPEIFKRDTATRRSTGRMYLREDTGLTDEAIEGWALMLSRKPEQQRRLEAKYAPTFGAQPELASTSWRASAHSSDEDQPAHPRGGGARHGGGRGGRDGRGGGGGGGNVAGAPGDKGTEQARRRKEAQKGSRANHNRRDQRSKKMARGGFPG